MRPDVRWRYAFAALALAGGCSSEESVIQPDAGVAPVLDAGPKDAGFTDDTFDASVDDAVDIPAVEDRPAPDAPAVEDVPAPRDLGPPRRLECGALARDEDPMGDYVILGSPVGGTFQLVVDVSIRNVGLIVGEPVDVTINGGFNTNVRRVHLIGAGAAGSVVRAPASVIVERAGTPASTVPDVRGESALRCLSACEPGAVPADEGCNTVEQARAYFQAQFGQALRWYIVQRSSWDGLYVFVSRGGCCLP